MMKNSRYWLLASGVVLALSSCASPVQGMITSDERRIWVLRGVNHEQVFRCADAAGPDAPPKPVCIRAPFVGAAE